MSDKTKKAVKTQTPDSTQTLSNNIKTNSVVMGEFMRGVPQFPIFCVNPL